MSRIRSIKPDFFRHEKLYEAERTTGLPLRLAFAGLWTVADREGRFRWQPRVIKLDVMPFDEADFGNILTALAENGFVTRYEKDGEAFGCIPSWRKHQHINSRELASKIPAPDQTGADTRPAPAQASGEGEREQEREREGKEGSLRSPSARVAGIPIQLWRAERTPGWFDQVELECREAAGLENEPSPSLCDTSPIVKLLDQGYDFARDILPKLRAAKAAKKHGRTWSYYVPAITEGATMNGKIAPKTTPSNAPPLLWLAEDDPRWPEAARLWHQAKGKPAPILAGTHGNPGRGWHFPEDMVRS